MLRLALGSDTCQCFWLTVQLVQLEELRCVLCNYSNWQLLGAMCKLGPVSF